MGLVQPEVSPESWPATANKKKSRK